MAFGSRGPGGVVGGGVCGEAIELGRVNVDGEFEEIERRGPVPIRRGGKEGFQRGRAVASGASGGLVGEVDEEHEGVKDALAWGTRVGWAKPFVEDTADLTA